MWERVKSNWFRGGGGGVGWCWVRARGSYKKTNPTHNIKKRATGPGTVPDDVLVSNGSAARTFEPKPKPDRCETNPTHVRSLLPRGSIREGEKLPPWGGLGRNRPADWVGRSAGNEPRECLLPHRVSGGKLSMRALSVSGASLRRTAEVVLTLISTIRPNRCGGAW